MPATFLLIDYENVQKVDLSQMPSDIHVRIFVGASQAKVPMTLVRQAQMLGPRLEWIQIDGQGSNALDFHIAYYLGKYVLEEPKARYVILSRDKGFDPLVRHLARLGHKCERIGQLSALFKAAPAKAPPARAERAPAPRPVARAAAPPPAKPGAMDAATRKVADLLSRQEEKRLPRRRASLATFVAGVFQKKISETEAERIIRQLFAAGLVDEENRTLVWYL